MKKIIRIIFLILGIILILNSIVSMILIPIHFGVTASLLIGIFLFFVFLYFNKITELIKNTKVGKTLFIFFIVGVCFFIFTESIIIFNEKREYNEKSDAIIVLGAGLLGDRVSLTLSYRLEKAIEYFKKYPDTYIVVSGGQGRNELIPEAIAMKKYLMQKGISEDKIIVEDKSTSTTENFKFSKRILDELFENKEYKVTYSTNGFHIYRAGKLAEKQGLTAYGLSAEDVWYMSITNHLREFFAVVKWWTLGY